MTEKKSYIIYLRVIATVFVVLIHASTGFLYRVDTQSFDWNYANWINSATRCAVPLFVVISGALLLSNEENVVAFYKKRLPKLVFPFAFWTLVYIVYYFYRYTNFTVLNNKQILSIIQDKILHGANAHLWYLYMILGLYLVIPFLQKIIIRCSNREIEIFLLIWFVSLLIMNKGFNDVMPKIDLTFFSGYIGYLVLGYYLSIKNISWKKHVPFIAYLVVIFITAIGTSVLSQHDKKLNTLLYNYLLPTTALATYFLFIGIKNITAHTTSVPNWVRVIDKYSFGVYLSHIIPLNYIHPLLSEYMSTAWVIPLATASTLIASILISYIVRSIPYGKLISG